MVFHALMIVAAVAAVAAATGSERGAQILMGLAFEYEVANVVDPHFTVVAKIRKSILATLKSR